MSCPVAESPDGVCRRARRCDKTDYEKLIDDKMVAAMGFLRLPQGRDASAELTPDRGHALIRWVLAERTPGYQHHQAG